MAEVMFQSDDVVQLDLTVSEEAGGLQVGFAVKARVPFMGTVVLPIATGKVPRDVFLDAARKVLDKLPANVAQEARDLVERVMERLRVAASGRVVLTLGDRTHDDKLDVTVSASGRVANGPAFELAPLTFQPPVKEMLDVAGLLIQAIPVPGAQAVAFLALSFAKVALRAMHVA